MSISLLALGVSGIIAAGTAGAEEQAPRIVDIMAASYPCSGTVFNDVGSNHWACGFIEEFLTLNITQGCVADNPGTPENEAAYCPGATVTRDQMAVFFVRAMEETLFDILDGAGNGLDADLLDGQHGDYYLDWNNLTNIPTDIANGDADTLGAMVCGDGEVPKFQNATSSWVCGNDLTGGGGGDITAVIAGTGLSGGATSGDATLNVAVPLALSGADANAVITGTNSETTGGPVGVLGVASATGTLTSTGVRGLSSSDNGTGVWGEAPMNGVYGKATRIGDSTWGVYGDASQYGVYGRASGSGVSGSSYGVFGEGATVGVYGKSTGGGWGIVSEGTALILGNLSVQGAVDWSPLTANAAVPATAFQPKDTALLTYLYAFENGTLKDYTGSPAAPFYTAPVRLPDGATVTRMTFYWSDGSNVDASMTLYRKELASGTEQAMALAFSSGGSSSIGGQTINTGSSFDDSITGATVDNAAYVYYLDFDATPDANDYSVWLNGVTITYTTSKPH
jgi:hypothetical protein